LLSGMGDWGLGIGDWGLGPIPNPQSPIPNPQSPIPIFNKLIIYKEFIFKLQNKYKSILIIIKKSVRKLYKINSK